MDQQLRLFTDAVLKSQGETQRLVRQVSQNIEIATQQAQEDNDNLIQALDDLREQIGNSRRLWQRLTVSGANLAVARPAGRHCIPGASFF